MAILTLALGIGSSTALFSVIENVLIEPFPYTDPGRLMSLQIVDTERSEPGGRAAFTGPELLDYMEQNQAFDRAIASSPIDVLYTTGEGTERFEGYLVTPGTFEFFGMPALLGRVMVSPRITSRARHPFSSCATRPGSPASAPIRGS